MQYALGMTSDHVYHWRLLLEEYGPAIEHIKGEDNTVAGTISRLKYDSTEDTKSIERYQWYYHISTLFGITCISMMNMIVMIPTQECVLIYVKCMPK